MSIPSIPEFYAGKNIFITGATGFIGKAIIEKLLRSCPRVGLLYVLLRPKRGKDMKERLKQLIQDPLYERVKKEQPMLRMEEKVIPMAGNVSELNLGLSPSDRQTLVDNVNVIFHVAASVRFDDSLTDAVLMNVRGSREACQIALDAKNLVAHIHVSTAFANCDRPEAREVLYPPKIDWRQMIEIAEKFDKNNLTILTELFTNFMPNTYCFTKNVAEHVAYDMMNGKKPCQVFRPSIVISTYKDEPVRGWIDNFNGPVGILIGYGKGVLRTMYAQSRYKPDYIPVDVVTKAILISAWDLAVRHEQDPQGPCTPEVLQCTSYNVADWLRPNLSRMAAETFAANQEVPLNDIIWIPSTHTTSSTFIWYVRTLLCMVLPALVLDGLLKLLGRKPMVMKVQKKMFVAQLALRYFMTNEWSYTNDNLLTMQGRILDKDKDDWDYDFKHYTFQAFMKHGIVGCRRYLLNESDDSIPSAKKHYHRMEMVNNFVHILATVFVLWVLWSFGVQQYGLRKIGL